MLRCVYFLFKIFLKPKEKITMLSRQGNTPPIDFTLLEDALVKQRFSGEIVILSKKIGKSFLGKALYALHILKQMYHIATSRVIVIDGYCIAVCVLKHKEEQSFVQIWHALNIVKKFGFLAIDKPWGYSSATASALCMHRNYTHIIAPAKETGEVLLKSFGASRDKLVLLGLPRIDYIISQKNNESTDIKNAYPCLDTKSTVLYAPTFRKGKKVDLSWISDTIDLSKYNVVVKLHPADKMGVDELVDKRVIVDEDFSCFDWMALSDKVITDYSGTGLEAALLDKQVYFYLYDYEEYKNSNGLNLDLYSQEISRYVTDNKQGLKSMLEGDYDFTVTDSYKEKYLNVDLNDCSGQLARYITGLAGDKDGTKRDFAGNSRVAGAGAGNFAGRK